MADEQVTSVAEGEVVDSTTTTKAKSKKAASGDLIMDVAHEIEGLSKVKALHEAVKLVENIETEYFRLGGVLNRINENSWFEGYPSFDDMVTQQFGFKPRKARYLITIYTSLVNNQIPWDKVGHLGWTKLKDLAPVLTLENVDEWVAKAEKMTVKDLELVLKGSVSEGEGGEVKVKDNLTKVKLVFHPDQAEPYHQAVAKAKGELGTEFDAVAVSGVMSLYLGGQMGALAAPKTFTELAQEMGMEASLKVIADLYPEYDIQLAEKEEEVAS